MRAPWCALLGLAACSQVTPVGAYRLPVPTSTSTVALKTILVKTVDAELVLFDAATSQTFATGHGDLSRGDLVIPFDFSVPSWAPLRLEVSQGVMQDTTKRPYKTVPLPALDSGTRTLQRVTLTDGAASLVVVSSGGNLFTEVPEAQPSLTDTPSPLFVLSSIAGTGLVLPAGFASLSNWVDAVSTYIPPDPTMPMACAAPFVAAIRTTPATAVTVPAGDFQTVQVREILNTCAPASPPTLLVYEINRWYATGVGPVQLSYQDANALTHVYQLVSETIMTNDGTWWPLAEGNSWTYQALDMGGKPVGAPVRVSVSAVETVKQP